MEQQMSQECASELMSLVISKITENACSHFLVHSVGFLLLCLCHVEPGLSSLPVGFELWLPKVWTLRRTNTSDFLKVTQDICIPTETLISAYKIYEIHPMPML